MINNFDWNKFGDYSTDCWNRLPCGICRITGSQCPKVASQPYYGYQTLMCVDYDIKQYVQNSVNESLNNKKKGKK